jgi:lysozyme
MITGIDVSENNGRVDWAKAAQAGVRFAYARATLGRDSNDLSFAGHRQAANAHGIRFGGYHLPYPSHSSAEQQARHFLSVAKPRPGDLVPAIDVEGKTPPDAGEAKLSTAQLVAWLRAWLRTVEEAIGAKPVVYTNPSWWSSRLQNANLGCPLWLAHYTHGTPTIPKPWTSYAIWQHDDHGTISGYGPFDLNRAASLDPVTIGGHAHPLLLAGTRGPDVVRLKRLLATWCDEHPPPSHFAQTDVFGDKTRDVVTRFQEAAGLKADGKVGTNTWTALERVVKEVHA